jgi:uncharacterized membrane protein
VHAELLILRFIHIVGGTLWVGSAFLSFFFLMPAIAQSGPAGGQVMMNLQKRKLFTFLPVVAILTMLSGLRLMQIVSGGFNASYFQTGPGRVFSMAGGIAILAFLIGIFVSRPAAMKMAKMQQAAASDEVTKSKIQEEVKALQRRAGLSGTIVTWMLALSAAGMALARYM